MDYYKNQVTEAIKDYMREERQAVAGLSPDELEDFIRGARSSDGITGNDSGSYYCNASEARECLNESEILLDDGFLGYIKDTGADLAELLKKGAETVDVWARCYIVDYMITPDELAELRDEAIAE